jgi:hypothetical protein
MPNSIEVNYIKQEVKIMSAREQLIVMLDLIGENEAGQILHYVKETFLLKPKTWDDIEEVEPSPDEIMAFKEYRKGGEGG